MSLTLRDRGSAISDYSPYTQYSLEGTLSHPDGQPLHHQFIEIYAQNVGLGERLLGSGYTDSQGHFDLSYGWKHIAYAYHHVIIKVFEEALQLEPYRPSQKVLVHESTFKVERGQENGDLGNLQVSLYEYKEGSLPLEERGGLNPQSWGFSYYFDLGRAGFSGFISEMASCSSCRTLTTEQVERMYELVDVGVGLKVEDTLDMLLNGIHPVYFRLDNSRDIEDGKTFLTMAINWDRYEQDEVSPALPNVDACFTLDNETKGLSLDKIGVQFKGKGREEFLFSDEVSFKKALYLLNSMSVVRGEVDAHLGRTHLWCGYASTAVFRHLKENPIGQLLKPHLREVNLINTLGASAIFGRDGVLNASGLTENGILQVLKDVTGSVNWKFQPRQPINDDHRFAKAGLLYWDIVQDVVTHFIQEHKAVIQEKWFEIYYLSETLARHAVDYRPQDGIEDRSVWFDSVELDYDVEGRVIVEGVRKAFSHITENKTEPSEQDWVHLQQFCAYVLFVTTWEHWAVHSSQGRWVSNLKFASLSPEESGELPYLGTRPSNAEHQLSVVNTLMNFDRGEFLQNMNGDIDSYFIQAVESKKSEFKALGYDLERMTYGIII